MERYQQRDKKSISTPRYESAARASTGLVMEEAWHNRATVGMQELSDVKTGDGFRKCLSLRVVLLLVGKREQGSLSLCWGRSSVTSLQVVCL
jgi:hypothetical protein